MTNQQLQYAYWQKMRQQQLYSIYRAGSGIDNQNIPPEPVYVTINFIVTEGLVKYLCNGEEVNIKTGVKILKGSTITIEAIVSDTYQFTKWEDEPERAEHKNPRTIENIVSDMTFKVELEKMTTQIQLIKKSDRFPTDYYWKLYQSETLDGTYTAVEKEGGRTEFSYGEGVDVRKGNFIKLQFVGHDEDIKIERIERLEAWNVKSGDFLNNRKEFFDSEGFCTSEIEVINIDMYFVKA